MPNPIISVFLDIPQSSEASAGSSAAQDTQRYKEIEQIAKYNRDNNTNFYTLAQIQEHQKKLQELEQAKTIASNPDQEDVRDAYISALNPQTTEDVDKIRKWDKDAATTNAIGLAAVGTIPEMATFGVVPGLTRYGLGLITGHYGSQAGTAAGGWLDDKLGTKVFSPALGFVGGLAGYGMGADMATGIGRIPLWKTYKPLSTNAPQLTGHFGQVKYYGPTMGKTTAAKSNPKLVDFDDIIRQPSRSILDRFGFKNKAEMYNSGNQEAIKAYEDMLVKSMRDWRANPENSNLTLVASPTAIANPTKTGFYFDNVPSIPSRSVFIARNVGRGGTPEASAMWYDSLMEKNPNLKIDNRFVSEIEKQAYISPNTGYKSIFMEEPIMGRGRPKKSSAEMPISPEAWDEMLFEDLIGEQGAINAARKASQAGKRVLKPITEAEKLGIPKSLRSDSRALEDPYYWGYKQWNQRYNDALNKGDYQEVQRIRDLHFKIKAPDTKVVDENGMPLHMYHGTHGPKRFQQYEGVNWEVEDAVKNGDLRNHWKIAKPIKSVMANYHTPNYETAIRTYGRGKEYLVYDDYLNIKKPFTYNEDDLHNLINSKFPGSSEKILHIERKHYDWGPLKGSDGKYLRDSDGKILWGQQLIPEKQYFKYTGVPDWSRFGWRSREILMQQGYDGLFIPQYHDSYGAFVSPSQFKAADPITWNGKGEIIPIVKRDNFRNPDIRYKQGGKMKTTF